MKCSGLFPLLLLKTRRIWPFDRHKTPLLPNLYFPSHSNHQHRVIHSKYGLHSVLIM